MQVQEFRWVELRRLENLRLAYIHILEGEDGPGRLLDLPANCLRDELLHKFLQVAARRLARHDLEHFLANFADLGSLCVGGLADLVGAAASEGDSKQTDEVAVRCTNVNVCLDERLPLADEGSAVYQT